MMFKMYMAILNSLIRKINLDFITDHYLIIYLLFKPGCRKSYFKIYFATAPLSYLISWGDEI